MRAAHRLALAAALPLAAGARTLVYCSEGSPENFTPAINTTGTITRQIARYTSASGSHSHGASSSMSWRPSWAGQPPRRSASPRA